MILTEPRRGPCVMCAGADSSIRSPLQQLLPPGRSRFIAETRRLVVLPTFGCFVVGYLLVVPRAHVLSFGQLDAKTLTEADALIAKLTDRLKTAYGKPVLGFEYGNNQRGGRRIEHAHWHLLPSAAALREWLDARLSGERVESLAELPRRTDHSYIASRDQRAALSVYPVPNRPSQRIRLRRLVAELDPGLDPATWDWASTNYADLIRQTVADLGPATRLGRGQR